MQGFIELIIAVAVLIWVLGPLARWQYENELRDAASKGEAPPARMPSTQQRSDPLASHPFYRPTKTRR